MAKRLIRRVLILLFSAGAGIGGYSGHDSGNIVIQGGVIQATGADHCAGIGSNDGCTGGTITIYGGTVTAKGGSDGAAIGGGRNSSGGNHWENILIMEDGSRELICEILGKRIG